MHIIWTAKRDYVVMHLLTLAEDVATLVPDWLTLMQEISCWWAWQMISVAALSGCSVANRSFKKTTTTYVTGWGEIWGLDDPSPCYQNVFLIATLANYTKENISSGHIIIPLVVLMTHYYHTVLWPLGYESGPLAKIAPNIE